MTLPSTPSMTPLGGDNLTQEITDKDRRLAAMCLNCPVCRRARSRQRGVFYWLVKWVEGGICPACRAYEKVYGVKAHQQSATHDTQRQKS